MNQRQVAVLNELRRHPEGMTGPEFVHVATRFGARSGMFEWGTPRLRQLEAMGKVVKTSRKRDGAWVWIAAENLTTGAPDDR